MLAKNLNEEIERQAAVSFKAGFEKGYRTGKVEGIQQGHREVAEWLDWGPTAYQTIDGFPIIRVETSKREWQAKLKSWDILA